MRKHLQEGPQDICVIILGEIVSLNPLCENTIAVQLPTYSHIEFVSKQSTHARDPRIGRFREYQIVGFVSVLDKTSSVFKDECKSIVLERIVIYVREISAGFN